MTTTRLFSLALFAALTFPALASAQVEIVDNGFAQPPGSAVVQVPIAPQPIVVQQQVAEPVQEVAEAEPDLDATFSLGAWMEVMSLDELSLELRDPEIAALAGITLDREWQGMDVLRQPALGGMMLSVGMRADGWIRGPELRLMFGATEIESPFVRAPGSELELSIENATVFRTELALGVQAPLGAFRPYLQARMAIGGAFFGVAVQDERLGSLGTENVDAFLFEGGLEAGLAFLVTPGIELAFGVRAGINHLGGESVGGFMTMNIVEDDNGN